MSCGEVLKARHGGTHGITRNNLRRVVSGEGYTPRKPVFAWTLAVVCPVVHYGYCSSAGSGKYVKHITFLANADMSPS